MALVNDFTFFSFLIQYFITFYHQKQLYLLKNLYFFFLIL